MCAICNMSLDDESKVLLAIEKKIKAGASPEHFQKILDKLLDTEMAERDEETEAAWEAKKNG